MKCALFLLSVAAVVAGCRTPAVAPDPSILRVGVSPRSQPMIFKENNQLAGVEADFARKLGAALKRETVFVEMKWDRLIDALEQNKIDIIMSNMTVTAPRSMRINFTTPYMQSGLSGLFRRDQYDASGLVASTIFNQNKRIGFVESTTGEYFCRRRFTRAKLIGYSTKDAAVTALRNNRIDMFVHDAPVIWWLAALNESTLVAFPEILNTEPLAWGIGRHNSALLNKVNEVLAQWRKDGTVKSVMQKWIPGFTQ
jgi:polar amino acid transport system substrate-binding protein